MTLCRWFQHHELLLYSQLSIAYTQSLWTDIKMPEKVFWIRCLVRCCQYNSISALLRRLLDVHRKTWRTVVRSGFYSKSSWGVTPFHHMLRLNSHKQVRCCWSFWLFRLWLLQSYAFFRYLKLRDDICLSIFLFVVFQLYSLNIDIFLVHIDTWFTFDTWFICIWIGLGSGVMFKL